MHLCDKQLGCTINRYQIGYIKDVLKILIKDIKDFFVYYYLSASLYILYIQKSLKWLWNKSIMLTKAAVIRSELQ